MRRRGGSDATRAAAACLSVGGGVAILSVALFSVALLSVAILSVAILSVALLSAAMLVWLCLVWLCVCGSAWCGHAEYGSACYGVPSGSRCTTSVTKARHRGPPPSCRCSVRGRAAYARRRRVASSSGARRAALPSSGEELDPLRSLAMT